MKVYVIMRGHYSDKHICGVAVNPVIAEEIRRCCSDPEYDYDKAVIEEYDTDDWSTLVKGGKLYDVTRLESGEIICKGIKDSLDYEYDNFVHNKEPWRQKCYDGTQNLHVYVIALGCAHAKKIAADKFTQFLAKEAGING